VVFQAGIAVDPVNGSVTPMSNGVTLSCFHGAPATVYSWNYSYTDPNPFYFASAIQMKRAAYCGDAHAYTIGGTLIDILDNDNIHHGTCDKNNLPYLEAEWTEKGAICVTRSNMRQPKLGFTGICSDGHYINICVGGGRLPPRPTPYLADALHHNTVCP